MPRKGPHHIAKSHYYPACGLLPALMNLSHETAPNIGKEAIQSFRPPSAIVRAPSPKGPERQDSPSRMGKARARVCDKPVVYAPAHLHDHAASGHRPEAAERVEQVSGAGRDVDVHRLTGRLHPGGRVHRVAEQTVPADTSQMHRPHKEQNTMVALKNGHVSSSRNTASRLPHSLRYVMQLKEDIKI